MSSSSSMAMNCARSSEIEMQLQASRAVVPWRGHVPRVIERASFATQLLTFLLLRFFTMSRSYDRGKKDNRSSDRSDTKSCSSSYRFLPRWALVPG